jgi:hypothetical protein
MPAADVTVANRDTHAIGNPCCRGHGVMRALTLVADRQPANALKRMESRQVFGKIIVYL